VALKDTVIELLLSLVFVLLPRVSIACCAEHCTSYSKSVCPSVYHTLALCQNDSSYDHAVFTVDSPMTLVSSRLTSARNSKGNIGSEDAE